MAEEKKNLNQDSENNKKRLAGLVRLTGVVFRILLISGLLLFIAAVGALIFTSIFTIWIILLPFSLIVLGVIIAWIEYRLHLRLYDLEYEAATKTEDTGDNRGF